MKYSYISSRHVNCDVQAFLFFECIMSLALINALVLLQLLTRISHIVNIPLVKAGTCLFTTSSVFFVAHYKY